MDIGNGTSAKWWGNESSKFYKMPIAWWLLDLYWPIYLFLPFARRDVLVRRWTFSTSFFARRRLPKYIFIFYLFICSRKWYICPAMFLLLYFFFVFCKRIWSRFVMVSSSSFFLLFEILENTSTYKHVLI